MNLSSIKSKIDEIDHAPSSAAEGGHPSLKAKALIRWREKVTEELKAILPENLDTPPIDASVMKSKLGTFLETNWNLIKGSYVDYLSNPDSDITELMVLVAEQVDELNPLQALMPGVWQENIMGGYSDLNTLPIRSVLKTHVLSDSGYYLYPVRLITEINITDAPGNLPNNPYFDYMHDNAEGGENAGKVTLGAYQRLEMHSPFTEAVVSAKRQYDKLSSDERHLLGQLNTLIAHLAINDAHGGRGQADSAGSGAYPAIIRFKEYYDTLPETKKAKIPHKLKQEINRLLELSSNKTVNENATENMETCIATRKTKLINEMIGHGGLLSEITMDEAKNSELIGSTISEFYQARSILEAELNGPTYSGCDEPGLTLRLLDGLGMPLTFDNPTDLHRIIHDIPVTDLDALFSRQEFHAALLSELISLGDLVYFIINTASNKLPTILACFQNTLTQILHYPRDLGIVLMFLEVEKIGIVAKSLKSDVFKFLFFNRGLESVLEELQPEQQIGLYEAIKDDLPTCIRSASDPVNALKDIQSEQMTALCQAMKNIWPTLIKTVDDFTNAIKYLDPKQITAVYDAMKDKLTTFIYTAWDFRNILAYLGSEERTDVYDAMKDKLTTFIYTADHFKDILAYLGSEQRIAVYDAMKEQLPTLIKTLFDFEYVIAHLNPEQITDVCDAIKDKLPTLIDTADASTVVLEHLNPEQIIALCQATKDIWPTLIPNLGDFIIVLRSLNPEQIIALCQATKDIWPKLIQKLGDFTIVLGNLKSPKQKTAFNEAMKEQLPTLIKTAEDFNSVLLRVPPLQRPALCETMKEIWPTIVQTGNDFQSILEKFTPYQQKAIGRAMASFISGPKLIVWLDEADAKTRQFILNALKDELPHIVLNQPNIQKIMQKGALATMVAFFNMATNFFNAIHSPQIDELLDVAVQETLNNISKYMSAEEADALKDRMLFISSSNHQAALNSGDEKSYKR